MNYVHWRLDDILGAVLPEGVTVAGFSQIGHIVHLNLKEHLQEYKKLIGEQSGANCSRWTPAWNCE